MCSVPVNSREPFDSNTMISLFFITTGHCIFLAALCGLRCAGGSGGSIQSMKALTKNPKNPPREKLVLIAARNSVRWYSCKHAHTMWVCRCMCVRAQNRLKETRRPLVLLRQEPWHRMLLLAVMILGFAEERVRQIERERERESQTRMAPATNPLLSCFHEAPSLALLGRLTPSCGVFGPASVALTTDVA